MCGLIYREAFRSRLETIVRNQANARSAEPEPSPVREERRRQDDPAHMAERPAPQVIRNQQAVAPSHRVDLDTTVHDLELRELLGR